ncbi:MAG: inositol monophosphatase family protein [Dehalococcoidia bacterium]
MTSDAAAPLEAPALDAATLEGIEALAVEFAREAGEMARAALQRQVTVEYKPDAKGKDSTNDPVSEVDRAVEDLVRRRLAERFPEHGIIGEEVDTPAASADVVWVLDPIDGTANFINGFPLFAVSVGVLHRGVPVAAAIWCASTHLLGPGVYHARAGGLLHLDGVEVSRERTVVRRALAAAPGGAPGGTREWEHRVTGSIAIEAALVAAGVFTSASFWAPRIWDVAAGTLLVQAAGREVWVRSRGQWTRFERFAAPDRVPQHRTRDASGADPPGPPGLRDWRQPVLIGTPEAVTLIRDRAHAPGLLRRLLGRLAGTRR